MYLIYFKYSFSETLIFAIHELSRESVSVRTAEFIKELERPLPTGNKPVKLFSLNYECEKLTDSRRRIRIKNCCWHPCLLTDQDEINNLYTNPSINASYQVSVLFAEWFQRASSLITSPVV
jgi:hypothetical protein